MATEGFVKSEGDTSGLTCYVCIDGLSPILWLNACKKDHLNTRDLSIPLMSEKPSSV